MIFKCFQGRVATISHLTVDDLFQVIIGHLSQMTTAAWTSSSLTHSTPNLIKALRKNCSNTEFYLAVFGQFSRSEDQPFLFHINCLKRVDKTYVKHLLFLKRLNQKRKIVSLYQKAIAAV